MKASLDEDLSMSANEYRSSSLPPIGMAFWLLEGGRLMDRIDWLIRNGFQGVSLLQSILDIDPSERQDVAAAIKSEQLYVTYHGNVHHKLTDSGKLDESFINRMLDDVIWWHENTNGVYSCCSDPIKVLQPDGTRMFDFDLNARHLHLMSDRLSKHGIRVGIENGFGGKNKFSTLNDISRMKETCSDIKIGMLLDAAHANIHVRSDGVADEDNINAYVSKLPLEIWEVHFSDNLGRRDEHKQLGYGNLNLKDLFAGLRSSGFSGKFTIEVCLDILSRKYASDINNPQQMDALLISRDNIIAAWSAPK